MHKKILVPVSFEIDRDVAGALDLAGRQAGDKTVIVLVLVKEQIHGYAIVYLPEDQLVQIHQAIEAKLRDMANCAVHVILKEKCNVGIMTPTDAKVLGKSDQ